MCASVITVWPLFWQTLLWVFPLSTAVTLHTFQQEAFYTSIKKESGSLEEKQSEKAISKGPVSS